MMSYRTVDPELESAVRHGRHLRSGDIGRFDDECHLLLTGRLKATIRTGGAHVSPPVVATVLPRPPALFHSPFFAFSSAQFLLSSFLYFLFLFFFFSFFSFFFFF